MKVIAAILGVFGVGLLLAAFQALIISVCWSYGVSQVFGLPEINLLQAFCLTVIFNTFFKTNVQIDKK